MAVDDGQVQVTIAAEHEQGTGAAVEYPASMPPVPEPGQVVNVRGSTWAVADVRQQGLPRSPADEGAAGLTHVVSLQSLEENRLGQELAVVWELEVGHTVAPDQGLPETVDAFDDPNTLAAFVDAVRWGAVTSADANSFQAPFRSGANVEAYQMEPLRRALQSARSMCRTRYLRRSLRYPGAIEAGGDPRGVDRPGSTVGDRRGHPGHRLADCGTGDGRSARPRRAPAERVWHVATAWPANSSQRSAYAAEEER